MMILFSVTGVLAFLVAAYVITGLYVTLPTNGKTIIRYSDPKSALIVMDMQNDITNNQAYGNISEFIERVNQAIGIAEESGMEILYVKNVYGNNPVVLLLTGGKGRKGTTGVEIDSRLHIVNENVFTKSRGDSFSSAEFERYLIAKRVASLYIVGADAAGCVFRTAQGARNRGYRAAIIKDAVITIANDTKMKQVEGQYQKDGIKTISLHEFIK